MKNRITEMPTAAGFVLLQSCWQRIRTIVKTQQGAADPLHDMQPGTLLDVLLLRFELNYFLLYLRSLLHLPFAIFRRLPAREHQRIRARRPTNGCK